MDTNQAITFIQAGIDELKTKNKELSDTVVRNNTQIEAYNVAIQQLQGLLDTPSVDLAKAKDEIASLSARVSIAEANEIDLTAKLATLSAPLAETTVSDSVITP